jgi:hypothetical protein
MTCRRLSGRWFGPPATVGDTLVVPEARTGADGPPVVTLLRRQDDR